MEGAQERLAEAQVRTEAALERLAEKQVRTEDSIRNLAVVVDRYLSGGGKQI